MQHIIKNLHILLEAFSYIKQFKGNVFVIKFGGALIDDKNCLNGILEDAVFLSNVGIRPVLVHGGGRAISKEMQRAKLQPRFIKGHRVTDKKTAKIVEKCLTDINCRISAKLSKMNAKYAGLLPRDKAITAKKDLSLGDLGYVGEVAWLNKALLKKYFENDRIPVFTSAALGADGSVYNINADRAAAKIAGSLGAEKFMLLTDVKGVMHSNGKLLSSLTSQKTKKLIETGIISGGMIPKVESALDAIETGVGKAHIIDGRLKHAVLLEIFTKDGIGTQILR